GLLFDLPQEGLSERGKRLQANLKVPSRPRQFPRPRGDPIDQKDRRDPALVAEDPGRKSGRYQMLARAEVECVAVEVGQQPDRFVGGCFRLRVVLCQHPSGLAFDTDFDNLARQRSQHPFGLASPGSATPPERKVAICSRPIGAQVRAADCLQGYIAIQIKPAPCSQPLIRSNEGDVLTAAWAEAEVALVGGGLEEAAPSPEQPALDVRAQLPTDYRCQDVTCQRPTVERRADSFDDPFHFA